MFPTEQINRFEKYWRRRKPGSSTATHYSSDVRIFFKWANVQELEEVTVHDIDTFIEWQQSLGRASATIRRRLVSLKMFYDFFAYTYNIKIENPVVLKRHYISSGRHLPRDIRQEDIEKLFIAIGNHLRDRTIFMLMLHTGVRVGEVVNLCRKDIYLLENRMPHLRVIGKGQQERIVYLSNTVTHLLSAYLSFYPGEREGKVFLNVHGNPISITGIQLQLAKYCRLAEIWVTCHQLRHTFACRMIAAGVPVTSVQKMLGHASLRTTQLYVEVADRQVEQDYHVGIQKIMEQSHSNVELAHV